MLSCCKQGCYYFRDQCQIEKLSLSYNNFFQRLHKHLCSWKIEDLACCFTTIVWKTHHSMKNRVILNRTKQEQWGFNIGNGTIKNTNIWWVSTHMTFVYLWPEAKPFSTFKGPITVTRKASKNQFTDNLKGYSELPRWNEK